MLTRVQIDVLDYIVGYQAVHRGVSPSLREIADEMGYAGQSGPGYVLDQLEERGYIRRRANVPRSITVLRRRDGAATDIGHLSVLADLLDDCDWRLAALGDLAEHPLRARIRAALAALDGYHGADPAAGAPGASDAPSRAASRATSEAQGATAPRPQSAGAALPVSRAAGHTAARPLSGDD